MGRRGERPLKELYDLTVRLTRPEITPVLEGSCHIQGPVDESDHELQRTNLSVTPTEKRFNLVSKSIHTRAESGTCNVCCAPCASCLHFNRTVSLMESNIDGGCSGDTHQIKEADSCSFISVDGPVHHKSRTCGDQHATSETSNLYSASSSYDSYSENAESKASLKASGTHDTSEDVDMPPKVSSGDVVGEDIEDKRRLECHGDNVSCITGVGDANVVNHDSTACLDKKGVSLSSATTKQVLDTVTEEVVQVVAAHGYGDHGIEEIEGKSSSSGGCPKESLQKKNSGFKDLEEDLSSHNQVGPSECSIKIVDFLVGGQLGSDNVDERKSAVLPDGEDSQKGHLGSSSGTSENVNSCSETEIGMVNEIPSNEVLKLNTMKEPLEKSGSLLEAPNIQGPEIQPQPSPQGENSESDIEDDVKVCDICGDAGREECLAVCSRCSDGAEHTYCMQIMLDKVPEGDWLCEECKLKEETENEKLDKSEDVTGTSKAPSLNEKSQNVGSTLNPKLLPRLDTKMIEPEERSLNKVLQSPQISGNKHADNLEVTSVANKKASDTNCGSEIASPRKKPVLSRESSFKNLDVGKGKPESMPQSGGSQSTNSPQAFVRSQTHPCSDTSKHQSHLLTSRGPLSKSTSFNKSNIKGKVIQLIENVPHKQKMTRESASGYRRKDGLVGTLNKSASLKILGSGRSNESLSKGSTLNSPCIEDPRGMKQVKEKSMLERKNSLKVDHSIVSPSAAAGIINVHPKMQQKAVRCEGKSNIMSEPNILGINKGSDVLSDLGRNEVKRQCLSLSKGFDNPSSNGICHPETQKPNMLLQRSVSQTAESAHCDNKTKDTSFFCSSRQTVTGSGRVLCCQKCNETGHATQCCSIDKLRVSALKPTAERISREGSNKSSKGKHAVESAISKTRMQKGRSSDQPEDILMPSAEMCSEVSSADNLCGFSSCLRNFPFSAEQTEGQGIIRYSAADCSKTAAVIDVKQQVGEGDAMLTSSDELNMKHFTEMLPAHAPALGNPLSASVFPVLEFIWQGGFDVTKTGKVGELFDGFQAHLSNCASSKVLGVVAKFPHNIKLEEVPRQSLWPSQFERSGPTEDNIALFFFAKDIESYEKTYRKLLDNLLNNDLALKGIIDGVELLVFPSTTLPDNSQRWNMLFFLWGVFRESKIDCVESLPGSQREQYGSSLEMEPAVQDVSSPVVAELSTFQKKDAYENPHKESSLSDRSPKAKALKPSTCVDSQPVSSSGIWNKICHAKESALVQESPFRDAAVNKLPLEAPSCSFSVSCSLKSITQPHASPGNCSESGLQVDCAQLCSEVKNDVNYLGNLRTDAASVKDLDSPPDVHPDTVHISFSNSGLPMRSVPAFCRPGNFLGGDAQSASEAKLMEREIQVRSEAEIKVRSQVVLDENLIESDHLSWDSRTNRKRSHSCSIDTASQASGETSRSTDDAMLWRERANWSTDDVMLWREKANCISYEDQKDYKKMKLYSNGHASSGSSREENFSGRLSSKVHPLLPSLLNENQQRDIAYGENMMHETSRSAERYFFPVDKGLVRDTKSHNFIHISSSDEDLLESNVPNLELALGGKKKPSKREVLPLLLPLVDRNSKQEKQPTDDGDDVSASLSLSLAFPDPEKERKAKPIPKTETLLSGRPCVNTSLLLFGGFTDK